MFCRQGGPFCGDRAGGVAQFERPLKTAIDKLSIWHAGKVGRSAAIAQVAVPKAQMVPKQDWSYVAGAKQNAQVMVWTMPGADATACVLACVLSNICRQHSNSAVPHMI